MEETIQGYILMIPALLLGIGLHEWAHAWAADKHGDSLPASQGRLSLNPLDHLDPMGTLCLIIAGFGWGKAVMINPSAYRNPLKDQMRVALAGPMMNFLLAAISLVVFLLASQRLDASTTHGTNILKVLLNLVHVNVVLGVFNLLPIPPLDGSKVLRAIGPVSVAEIMGYLESTGMGMMILLFVLMSGILRPLFAIVQVGFLFLSLHLYYAGGFLIFMLVAWKVFVSTFPKYF